MSTTHADTGAAAPMAGVASGTITATGAVTRVEIADMVDSAFDNGNAGRGELIETARAAGARPEVLATLTQLPDNHYGHLRQLWVDLPHVPVEL